MNLESKEKEDKEKEIKINVKDKEYHFKQLTGWDVINSANPKVREALQMQVRMIARASYKPKLSVKDILNKPYTEYQDFMDKALKAQGMDSVEDQEDFLE